MSSFEIGPSRGGVTLGSPIGEVLGGAGMARARARAQQARFEHASEQLPGGAELGWFVPGRIEVLGKHTDYAGGPSLFSAAEHGICVAASPRDDALLRLHTTDLNETTSFAVGPDTPLAPGHWSNYLRIVGRRLARNFPAVSRGADIAIASDLPLAAGMSSSSALITGGYLLLAELNDLEADPGFAEALANPETVPAYLGAVENGADFASLKGEHGVGTRGGCADHAAIVLSKAGHLRLCRTAPVTLEATLTLPANHSIVIGVSGVKAEKGNGATQASYNALTRQIERMLERWQHLTGRPAASLGEIVVDETAAEALRRDLEQHEPGLVDRFDQFRAETTCHVPRAAEALKRGDLEAFGQAVDASHHAAEHQLGNQVPETATLARTARQLGAVAASAFGGGFGGSVWALVPDSQVPSFTESWRDAYEQRHPTSAMRARFFTTGAGPPAIRVR